MGAQKPGEECRWYLDRKSGPGICTHPRVNRLDFINGGRCRDLRSTVFSPCGKEGKLWEAKQEGDRDGHDRGLERSERSM